MHSIPNKQNSRFQTAYFLAGSCHTADGAYALLCSQREGRETALGEAKASAVRAKIKVLKANKLLASEEEEDRLEGEAMLLEMEAHKDSIARCLAGAEDELAHINALIAELQPYRKFSHLPDAEAHDAAQYDEWKMELIRRAENFLLTDGRIPSDQFNTMRMHPAFISDILPAIEHTKLALQSHDQVMQLLQRPTLQLGDDTNGLLHLR